MRSSKIGYLTKEGFKSILTHGFMSFASVTIIVACLVIMGSFSLIAVNIGSLLDEVESQTEVVAYVEETLSDEQARALQPEIEYISNVQSCEFVPRQTAMEEYASLFDDQLFQDVGSEILRDRYVIHLADISLTRQTQADLESIIGVAYVRADLQVAEALVGVRNVLSGVSLILVVVLVLVSVFIMANTVKLATYSRRDEIVIMKMVGASNWFIRFPFVVEGLVLGLLGGAMAFILEWGIYDVVAEKIMSGFMGNLIHVIPFSSVSAVVMLIYMGVGLAVGVFGSSIAIRNYLEV